MLCNGILERIFRVLDDFFDITQRLFGLALNLPFQALRFLARISNQFPSLLLDFSSRILEVPPSQASVANKSGRNARCALANSQFSRKIEVQTCPILWASAPCILWRTAGSIICPGRALGEMNMLETIAIILLVLWVLGLVSSYTMGGFIHILLVVAVVVIVIRLIQGRRL